MVAVFKLACLNLKHDFTAYSSGKDSTSSFSIHANSHVSRQMRKVRKIILLQRILVRNCIQLVCVNMCFCKMISSARSMDEEKS